MSEGRYAIVTPAHNEAEFLPRVIRSVAAQIIKPEKWVIVDDRSSDATWEIITSAAEEHSYIHPVKITGDPGRVVWANVVRVFNTGYEHVPVDIPFIVLMDADILLPDYYFAYLLSLCSKDPGLGMVSGKTFVERNGEWVMERSTDISVVGACQFFRHDCFKEIGGLPDCRGWDSLDAAKARMMGWRTASLRSLPIYHLRALGSALGVGRTNRVTGGDNWFMWSHPLFVLAKSLYRSLQQPYLSGLWILAGFIEAWLRGEEKLADKKLARFIRQEQLDLLFGKLGDKVEILPRRL